MLHGQERPGLNLALSILLLFVCTLAACNGARGVVTPLPSASRLAPATATTATRAPSALPATVTPPLPTRTAVPTATWQPTLTPPAGELEAQQQAMLPAFTGDVSAMPHATRYLISVEVGITPSGDSASLRGMARIRYANTSDEPLGSFPLMLWPNQDQYQGRMTAGPVIADGTMAPAELGANGIVLWVTLPSPLAPGALLDVSVPFRIDDIGLISRARPQRFGITEGVLLAPTFYPLLPPRDADGWWSEMPPPGGDRTNSEVAFYDVTITAPAGFEIVTSGVEIESGKGAQGERVVRSVSGPVRDFAFVLGPFDRDSVNENGVEVRSWYLAPHAEDVAQMLSAARGQLRTLNRLVGPYPYRELDLIDGPGAFGGVEYPGLVFIGTLGTQWVIDPTVHEVAHQWFYALVGNDQLKEPWLDEAFASYAQVLYYEEQVDTGRATAQLDFYREMLHLPPNPSLPIGLPVDGYASETDYGLLVYYKGALFLDALRRRLGDERFFEVLQEYFRAHRYGIGDSSAFQRTAEDVCECDLGPMFDRWVYQGGELPGP
jgi:hypothetical protein